MTIKHKFGYGHDPCFNCNKIDDPLIGVRVMALDEYRSNSKVNISNDRLRIVLDLEIKNHQELYKRLIEKLEVV